MDIMAILLLVEKGVAVASTLIAAAQNAEPALQAIKDLITGAKTGTVTQADLDKTEAVLDALIDDFNTDLPPSSAV